MSVFPQFQAPPPPPGLTIRQAGPHDNEALIALDLESPLRLGETELVFDRSPDFFLRHRLQPEHRIVVGEMEGRLVGVLAGAIHSVRIQGEAHRLAYILHNRIHPSWQRRGVAGALAMTLMAWAQECGAEGGYWLIAPDNESSIAFGGRGGGRWPLDVTLVDIDVAEAEAPPADAVGSERLPEVVALVNSTHEGEELFEPYTQQSLRDRLARDSQYSLRHLRAVVEGRRLLAVGGLWDWGAAMESISSRASTGETTRSRTATVLDWGHLPGREDAFARLLRSLTAEARRLGRTALTLCEPSPGAVPDTGLPVRHWSLSLFAPTLTPPPAESIRGLYADLVYV